MKLKYIFSLHAFVSCILFCSIGNETKAQEAKKTVAIIGSGVAGLSSAYFLTPQYQVEVLEMRNHTGGNHLEMNKEKIKDKEEGPLNLGASYVPNDDSYSRKLFEAFEVPLKPVSLNEAWTDFDHQQHSRIILDFLPFFMPIYLGLRAANKFNPKLENQVTVKSVLDKMPRHLRRKALFSVAYDPFVAKDMDEVLFLPFMNYVLWVFSASASIAPWGTLTNNHIHPHLEKYPEFHLTTKVANIKIKEQASSPKYEIQSFNQEGDLIKTIHADSIIYSGYPQEAATNLEGIISDKLAKALKNSFYRNGRSFVVKAPEDFQEKSLYFMSRIHNNKEVNAMIDGQGSDSLVRVFYMDNCQKQDLLDTLNIKEEDILDESYDFVHYAPDHISMYKDLRQALKEEESALDKKGIYFSSYSFHPSGFRNADQSISMSTGTAKKIFDSDETPYSPQLKPFLEIKNNFTKWQKAKRKTLNNIPY